MNYFDPTNLGPILREYLPEGTPLIQLPVGDSDMMVATEWTYDTIRPLYIDPISGMFLANKNSEPIRFVDDTIEGITVRFVTTLRGMVATVCQSPRVDQACPVIVGYKNHASDHYPCLYIAVNLLADDYETHVYSRVYSTLYLQAINQGISSSDNESIASPAFE